MTLLCVVEVTRREALLHLIATNLLRCPIYMPWHQARAKHLPQVLATHLSFVVCYHVQHATVKLTNNRRSHDVRAMTSRAPGMVGAREHQQPNWGRAVRSTLASTIPWALTLCHVPIPSMS